MIKLGYESKENSLREIETEAKVRRQRKVPTLSFSGSVCVSAGVMGIWDGGIIVYVEVYVGEWGLVFSVYTRQYNSTTLTSHRLKDELQRRHFLYTTLILFG
jgi:hypothetical protein